MRPRDGVMRQGRRRALLQGEKILFSSRAATQASLKESHDAPEPGAQGQRIKKTKNAADPGRRVFRFALRGASSLHRFGPIVSGGSLPGGRAWRNPAVRSCMEAALVKASGAPKPRATKKNSGPRRGGSDQTAPAVHFHAHKSPYRRLMRIQRREGLNRRSSD
jgi:hypothetical protein